MSIPARPITPEYHALLVDTIKTLAMDAVQQANSGHPGMPMGAANMTATLWTRFLKHDPAEPSWPDRDRFVLSAGLSPDLTPIAGGTHSLRELSGSGKFAHIEARCR